MTTHENSEQARFNAETEEFKKLLIQKKIPENQLLHACAALFIAFKDSTAEIKALKKTIGRYQFPLDLIIFGSKSGDVDAYKLLQYLKQSPQTVQLIELINAVLKADKKRNASHAAKTRHKTTSAKREEVITYWRKHIYPSHPKLSNEKIGAWLHDSFPTLSVRKLSEYVGEAKKAIKKSPPASKA